MSSTARQESAATLGRAVPDNVVAPVPTVTVAYDRQRSRVRLHPIAEAGARIAFAWLRNQRSFRDRRPIVGYARRTAEFFSLRDEGAIAEAEMYGLSVLVPTSDGTLGRSVYASGDWDPLMEGVVYEALDAYGQPYRGATFVEVGANFGVYALPAIARHDFGRAVAYEPDPSSFELLQRNIERNALGGRITARQVALSAAPGELTLALGRYNAGDNRIVAPGAAVADRVATVKVPAGTFDDEVAAGHIVLNDLGLAWIDVQGHELEVLKGARSLLAAGVPLVIEYASAMGDRAALDELAERLADSYSVMVDLGWCALTNRLRFQPAWAVRRLAADGRPIETDLLMLPPQGRS
jgi:FkbM family methyltransferase